MKNLHRIIALMFISLFAVSTAQAEQGAIRLSNIAMKQVITVTADGRNLVEYVEPSQVIPGDVILYTIEFENISDQPASNIVLDDPVPNNSVYREGSARGANTRIQFSIDGQSFDSAENLMVTKDGSRQLAAAADYTAIRWIYTQDLKPGEKSSVTFKTRIKKPGE